MFFPSVGGVFFVFVLLCIIVSPFLFCNHFEEEERACCFALLFCGCLVTVNVLWLFLAVPWVCLRCVIVVFPDHTHLLFNKLTSWLYSIALSKVCTINYLSFSVLGL